MATYYHIKSQETFLRVFLVYENNPDCYFYFSMQSKSMQAISKLEITKLERKIFVSCDLPILVPSITLIKSWTKKC